MSIGELAITTLNMVINADNTGHIDEL